jgi:hypothetical protein
MAENGTTLPHDLADEAKGKGKAVADEMVQDHAMEEDVEGEEEDSSDDDEENEVGFMFFS